MTDKIKIFLFHPTKGQKLFNATEEEVEALLEDGWKDTPAGFKKQAKKDKAPDNTSAELSKEQEQYLQVFLVEPKQLDKDELIELGKGFGVKLMPNYKEATMIEKIKEKLDDNG